MGFLMGRKSWIWILFTGYALFATVIEKCSTKPSATQTTDTTTTDTTDTTTFSTDITTTGTSDTSTTGTTDTSANGTTDTSTTGTTYTTTPFATDTTTTDATDSTTTGATDSTTTFTTDTSATSATDGTGTTDTTTTVTTDSTTTGTTDCTTTGTTDSTTTGTTDSTTTGTTDSTTTGTTESTTSGTTESTTTGTTESTTTGTTESTTTGTTESTTTGATESTTTGTTESTTTGTTGTTTTGTTATTTTGPTTTGITGTGTTGTTTTGTTATTTTGTTDTTTTGTTATTADTIIEDSTTTSLVATTTTSAVKRCTVDANIINNGCNASNHETCVLIEGNEACTCLAGYVVINGACKTYFLLAISVTIEVDLGQSKRQRRFLLSDSSCDSASITASEFNQYMVRNIDEMDAAVKNCYIPGESTKPVCTSVNSTLANITGKVQMDASCSNVENISQEIENTLNNSPISLGGFPVVQGSASSNTAFKTCEDIQSAGRKCPVYSSCIPNPDKDTVCSCNEGTAVATSKESDPVCGACSVPCYDSYCTFKDNTYKETLCKPIPVDYTGVIVGCTIGGVFLIAAAITLVFGLKKSNCGKRRKTSYDSSIEFNGYPRELTTGNARRRYNLETD